MTSLKGGLISEGILTLFDMLDMKLNQANAPEAIGGGTGGKSYKSYKSCKSNPRAYPGTSVYLFR